MTVPTYQELFDSIQNDIKTRFGIASLVGKVVFNAFAAVHAAKLKILYLSAEFIYKNIFPDTADPYSVGGTLERFGFVKLGRLPYPATAGVYNLTITGNIGATVPAGTTWRSTEESTSPGKMFINDSAYTLSAASMEISVRALDIGVGSKLETGDKLQSNAPLMNVNDIGIVESTTTSPTEEEDIETYRQKVIESYQVEPQGGAGADYRIWASDAAGVRVVYPYVRNAAAGEIDIYTEANPADSEDGWGTPSQAILDDVLEVIEYDPNTTLPDEERGRRPLGVYSVHCIPIIINNVDVVIYDLSDSSFIPQIQDAIIDHLFNIRPFVDNVDNPTERYKDKLYIGDLFSIVKAIIGNSNTFTNLTMSVGGTDYSVYQFKGGNIPHLNSLTEN